MKIKFRKMVKTQNKLLKNAGYWFAKGIDLGQNNRSLTIKENTDKYNVNKEEKC